MSEKGVFFKKGKNRHGSHNKCSKGSEFPRENVDYYEGTHLGMCKHINRRGRHILKVGGWENRGFVKDNILLPLILAHVGKPYKELTKAYYAKTKRLREQHKDVGIDKLNWYFQNFYSCYWHRQFYIDDEGIVRTDSSWDSKNNFTNAQLRHNRDQEIPQYGKVCVNYRDISGYYPKEDFSLISKEPVFMGNFYCDINGEILLLPVYHVPYFKECEGDSDWRCRFGFVPWYLKPNTPENKKYLEMCEKWTKVTIAIKRNEHSHTFVHHFFGKVPNTKKEEMARDIELWRKLRELASDKKDRRYAKLGLKVIVSKYESTPDFIEMEAGYGKLFPMVKTEDYEKAKRELE